MQENIDINLVLVILYKNKILFKENNKKYCLFKEKYSTTNSIENQVNDIIDKNNFTIYSNSNIKNIGVYNDEKSVNLVVLKIIDFIENINSSFIWIDISMIYVNKNIDNLEKSYFLKNPSNSFINTELLYEKSNELLYKTI